MTRKETKKKYTRVVKTGDAWNTYLQIDQQGFCVVEQTTKRRAEWFARMLAIAIERMLHDEHAGMVHNAI